MDRSVLRCAPRNCPRPRARHELFEAGYPALIAFCKIAPGDDVITLKPAQIGFDIATALAIVTIVARVFTTLEVLLFAAAFALQPIFAHSGISDRLPPE